jgi:hypothetical protein
MIFFIVYLQKDLDTVKSINNDEYYFIYYDVLQKGDF